MGEYLIKEPGALGTNLNKLLAKKSTNSFIGILFSNIVADSNSNAGNFHSTSVGDNKNYSIIKIKLK